MTPFKGVRVFTRAGQGLLNSEAELDELLERVLGNHIASGICEVARDDIQIGGNLIDQTIQHWKLVLSTLAESNLKLTPRKVRFFPQTTEIYGWKYQFDGTIRPYPLQPWSDRHQHLENSESSQFLARTLQTPSTSTAKPGHHHGPLRQGHSPSPERESRNSNGPQRSWPLLIKARAI